jgi:hypothetical protein
MSSTQVRIHIFGQGGLDGRRYSHDIVSPRAGADLLAHVTYAARPGLAQEIAESWEAGALDVYEATSEHQVTYTAIPEGSPHLDPIFTA